MNWTEISPWLAARLPTSGPGAAVLVRKGDEVLARTAHGMADLATGAPLTPEHRFHIASIGKQLTCLAIMRLKEEGRLDYDEFIGRYVPQLAHLDQGVTIRRLMHHTAGISDYYEDETLMARLLARSTRPDNQDGLALLAEIDGQDDRPGHRFRYSNTGYEMLGSLLAAVAGVDYAQFVRDRVLVPLGMSQTFSLPLIPDVSSSPIAHSYQPDNPAAQDPTWTAYDSDPLDGLLGAGSFYSTLDDWARYDDALYRGACVTPQTLAEAWQPATLNDGTLSSYGFGWRLMTRHGQPVYGHTGHWLAFSSAYLRAPRSHICVMVWANFSSDVYSAETIADELLAMAAAE